MTAVPQGSVVAVMPYVKWGAVVGGMEDGGRVALEKAEQQVRKS